MILQIRDVKSDTISGVLALRDPTDEHQRIRYLVEMLSATEHERNDQGAHACRSVDYCREREREIITAETEMRQVRSAVPMPPAKSSTSSFCNQPPPQIQCAIG